MIRLFLFAVLSISCFQGRSQAYFQQDVSYIIDVKLNDVKHSLEGYLQLRYTNNSPDDLNFIWMHLWPNAYKNRHTALARQSLENSENGLYFSDSTDQGYIDNLSFIINGQPAKIEAHPDHIDIVKLVLNEPLKSGSTITIETPFNVKIPSGEFSRLGHVGESYQITQGYPKPAVYDKDGWHEMPYLGLGEFYSEFGSFHVSITVPKNYVLGATGDLQNEDEKIWLLKKAQETKEKIKNRDIGIKGKRNLSFPPSSSETKTLTFVQNKVHDFAWFADKRYHVLHDTVRTPYSKDVVDCWSMFTDSEARLWLRSTEYIKDAIYYYSLWNGDYPYKHCTAVDGTISAGGGMEYPNVTVIGHSGSAFGLETVIVHEVGHNWFYGILGSNERDHAWMDEGLNTLNESRYIETKYPDKTLMEGALNLSGGMANKFRLNIFKHKSYYELSYLINARRNYDQPIEMTSAEYTLVNYSGIVYSKTGIVFDYLKAYLGDELFDKAMQTYFERWKFKHPQPSDLQAVFEEITGKEMNWFFNDLIKTTKTLDFKISNIKSSEWGDLRVKLKSKGEINGPFMLSGIVGDSIIQSKWYDSIPEEGYVVFPSGEFDQIVIDPLWDIPELTRTNNHLKTKGLLKKVEPVRLQFLGGIEDPYKTTIYWAPAMAWNEYDGFMMGLGFYNSVFPQKRFEFAVAPMYGVRSENIAGTGFLAYNFRTKHNALLQNIRIESETRRFHYDPTNTKDVVYSYFRMRNKLRIELRRKRLRYSPSQTITARHILQGGQEIRPIHMGDITYKFTKILPRYRFTGEATARSVFMPTGYAFSMGEINLVNEFSYNRENKKVKLRAHLGLLASESSLTYNYALNLSGIQGNSDYTYDHYFLGRNEDVPNALGQQMVMTQGGFRSFVPVVSDTWLSTFNLDVELPLTVDINIFADFGLFPTTIISGGMEPVVTIETAFDAGLSLGFFNDFLTFHFPLFTSDIISNYQDINNISYPQSIRFELNLLQLSPFRIINSIEP